MLRDQSFAHKTGLVGQVAFLPVGERSPSAPAEILIPVESHAHRTEAEI